MRASRLAGSIGTFPISVNLDILNAPRGSWAWSLQVEGSVLTVQLTSRVDLFAAPTDRGVSHGAPGGPRSGERLRTALASAAIASSEGSGE
ncbi:MAG: hypothetical protein K0S37_4825 [Microbacterium sp.]|nr:hypothetical protein [Microbacterium sp.]